MFNIALRQVGKARIQQYSFKLWVNNYLSIIGLTVFFHFGMTISLKKKKENKNPGLLNLA